MGSKQLNEILGVTTPILLAGMGGIAGPALAAAVSNAGAAGCVGGYKLKGDQLGDVLLETAALTSRSFGINFIPEVVGSAGLEQQIDLVVRISPPQVFITLFGMPDDDAISFLRKSGRRLVIQVGTVDDAEHAADFCDVVVLQGIEAGGHLLGQLSLAELFARCNDRGLRVPLVVSGGIADIATIRQYRSAGAAGVQLGTAFLVAEEAQTHPTFVDRVLAASASDTVITDRFTIGWPGRRHRVLAHPVAVGPRQPSTFIGRTTISGRHYVVPRYSAAVPTRATSGRIEEMVMYCGTSCERVTATEPAHKLVARLAAAFED
jgi:nitronate monooxygenase